MSWINFRVDKALCILSLMALDLFGFCGVWEAGKDTVRLDQVSLGRCELSRVGRVQSKARDLAGTSHCKEHVLIC